MVDICVVDMFLQFLLVHGNEHPIHIPMPSPPRSILSVAVLFNGVQRSPMVPVSGTHAAYEYIHEVIPKPSFETA